MCTTQTLLKALPTSIQGIMNSCIENNLISDMSVRSWKQNLPVGVLNYLLCHYTSPRSFRPIHLIISLLHLCSVHKGTTTHTLERSKGELQSSVQKLGGEMYFLLWKFTVIHTCFLYCWHWRWCSVFRKPRWLEQMILVAILSSVLQTQMAHNAVQSLEEFCFFSSLTSQRGDV